MPFFDQPVDHLPALQGFDPVLAVRPVVSPFQCFDPLALAVINDRCAVFGNVDVTVLALGDDSDG
jgi:hypothetical protein